MPAPLEIALRGREQIHGVGDPPVADEKAGALPHRVLAKIEHAPVAPDQHRIVAEAEHRFGQLPMRRDQRLPQAEMVLEIGVDRRRQCEPARLGRGHSRRWRKRAPFPEDGRWHCQARRDRPRAAPPAGETR